MTTSDELAAHRTSLANLRSHLANERTHLAYLRTAVSLVGFGITLNRFSIYLLEDRELSPGSTRFLLRNTGYVGAGRLTVGLILFVVAFQLVMMPYQAPPASTGPASERPTVAKLVFPMVLTPYGIAAVIVLLALSKGMKRTDLIVGMLLAVMLLDLLAMAFARALLRVIGPALQALGVVLSVLQLALALQIMLAALRGLGVVGGAA
jgi:uncharacterized membrane protein YidH (DUF202 family)